jgi:hypothetical protein
MAKTEAKSAAVDSLRARKRGSMQPVQAMKAISMSSPDISISFWTNRAMRNRMFRCRRSSGAKWKDRI